MRVATVLALLTVGCGEPLVERQLVVDTRVLAVKVEPADDPGRAVSLPGEALLAKVLVAGASPPEVAWSIEVCTVESTTSGPLRCVDVLSTSTGKGRLPEVTWRAPADGGGRVAVLGLLCDTAVANTGAGWPEGSCRGGKPNHFSFEVARGEANRHPSLERDELRVDGMVWDEQACVAPASAHVVTWSVAEANLEADTDGNEELLLAHFVTGGELERAYSLVSLDARSASVEWTAPPEASDETFYFVARDQRGGVDWSTRSLCVSRESEES